jgi:uncharacterized protein with PIN domain/sulfur carrier protein ThiS
MIHVSVRFYEELNFFLPSDLRKQDIEQSCKKGTTVKALVEICGIPHTEVDLILVNGESVPFSYQLRENDRISVYPVFESFDINAVSRVRSTPLRVLCFILDVHLGKLAKQLRLLGFDTLYSNKYEDQEIARIAAQEKRVVLTRDTGLLKRKIISHGYYVRSRDPGEQVREVVKRFDMIRLLRPFSRCIKCNTPLESIAKGEIIDRIPEKISLKYNSFFYCPVCENIYWQGSHWKRMREILDQFLLTGK